MSIREQVTLDGVIDFLNELVELDPLAVSRLIETRVACNQALAEHPTAQVMEWDGKFQIGCLGVLNGLFGVDSHGYGPISFVWLKGRIAFFVRTDKIDFVQANQPYEVDADGRRIIEDQE